MTVFNNFAGKTVYMIMPDRFAIGGGKSAEQKLAEPAYANDPIYKEWGDLERKAWTDRPTNPSLGNDYFGGDLQGIIDNLDYLQDLGVDLIYLTPIFRATSNHKYDTSDFLKIDPMFGDLSTLSRLTLELEKRGMGLILDAVINHVGDNHAWFKSAKNGLAKYKDYFYFRPDGSYACWWDYRHLPELNIETDELRDYFYRNTDSVLKYYLDLGIKGWRFDAAPDIGQPYVQDIRAELSQSHPDALMIGELTCFASQWVNNNDSFHGAMNYFMRDAIMHWIRGLVDGKQLSLMIQRYCDEFGEQAASLSWNILSSHDQPRLNTMFPEIEQRALALALQFTLPGCPTIYYGEEIGMTGGPEPDCRAPMPWNPEQWDLRERGLYKHFINLRKARRELREGKLLMIGDQLDDAEFVAYIRHTEVPEEYTIILINSAPAPMRRIIFLPYSHIYDGVILQDNMAPETQYRVSTGNIEITMAPHSVAILTPKLDQFTSFRFYKSRAAARTPISA